MPLAVVSSLLNGTDISLLLHPAVSHRDLRAPSDAVCWRHFVAEAAPLTHAPPLERCAGYAAFRTERLRLKSHLRTALDLSWGMARGHPCVAAAYHVTLAVFDAWMPVFDELPEKGQAPGAWNSALAAMGCVAERAGTAMWDAVNDAHEHDDSYPEVFFD